MRTVDCNPVFNGTYNDPFFDFFHTQSFQRCKNGRMIRHNHGGLSIDCFLENILAKVTPLRATCNTFSVRSFVKNSFFMGTGVDGSDDDM